MLDGEPTTITEPRKELEEHQRPTAVESGIPTPAGGMIELAALGEGTSVAVAVNASGQVVGASFAGDLGLRPVLWQPIANLGCDKTLAGCNLKGANLRGAYLTDRNRSDTNLKDANLTNAILAGAT